MLEFRDEAGDVVIPERTEKIQFKIECKTPKENEFVENAIRTLTPWATYDSGDTLTITYEVNVAYIGQVAEKLQAVLDLMHFGCAVDADIETIDQTRSLLVEVVREIETLKTAIQTKTARQ